MCSSVLARSLCILALATSLASAQESLPQGGGVPRADQARPAHDPPAQSLFNDRLRKFKFDLEHVVVTAETAEMFLVRYKRPDNPRIIGAYADTQTNALVVIGPPEAEQAIREHLAQALIEAQGTGATSLPLKLRALQDRRRIFLEEMAALEIQKTEVAASDQAAKSQQLADRLQTFENEVQLIERQMEIVRKYLERLDRHQPAASP